MGGWSPEWRERRSINFASGFADNVVTPPPDYRRLPPLPPSPQRSARPSSLCRLVQSGGTTPDPVRRINGKMSDQARANMRAGQARRRAAQKEAKSCPVSSAN
jgi:hypothetical protein